MQTDHHTGIWIDGSKAIIVSLDHESTAITELQSEIESRTKHRHEGDPGSFAGSIPGANGSVAGPRKLDNRKKFSERRLNQRRHFITEVVKKIESTSGDIYILGSGQTRHHLKKVIDENHATAERVKGMEACPKLTVNQLVQRVKQFFLLPDRILSGLNTQVK
jgi:hypothetical protein